MKYKLTEKGNIVVSNGQPVVIDDDGKESTINALGANVTLAERDKDIATLKTEAKDYRTKLAAAKLIVDKLGDHKVDDLIDTKARYGNLEADHKTNFEAYKASLDDGIKGKDTEILTLKSQLSNHLITNAILQSGVIEKTVYNPDHFLAIFERNFELKEGKPVASLDGQPIYSKENPGTPASVPEALAHIIDKDPARDQILKGSGMQGGGSPPDKGKHSFKAGEAPKTGLDRIRGAISKSGIPGKGGSTE